MSKISERNRTPGWKFWKQAEQARQQQGGADLASNRSVRGKAPEEYFKEGALRLAQDRTRNANLSYPAYTGETISPMSAMTAKARQNRAMLDQKGLPYGKKIESVLSRGNQGFSPEQIQSMLDLMQQGGIGANAQLNRTVQKQVRESYNPARLEGKAAKDMGRALPEYKTSLENTGRIAGNLEGERNKNIVNLLQGLQGAKRERQEKVIGMQEQFGNQFHTQRNLANSRNKAEFDRQANMPNTKAQMLEEALRQYGPDVQEGKHPDIARNAGEQIAKSMQAYERPSAQYSGKLTADLNPELLTAYDLAERISPNVRHSQHQNIKDIVGQLASGENVSSKALAGLPDNIRAQVKNLNRSGKQQLKGDISKLAQEFTKLGQFGSPQYVKAIENRKREIGKGLMEAQNKILQGGLGNLISTEHGADINRINQAKQMGGTGQSEFENMMKQQYDLNKQGTSNWENEDERLKQLYKNFQNEALWEWPHLRNQIGQQGVNQGMNMGTAYGQSLGALDLQNLNNKYNALFNQHQTLQGSHNKAITDIAQYEQKRADELRRQQQEAERQRLAAQNQPRAKQPQQPQAKFNPTKQAANPWANLYVVPQNLFQNVSPYISGDIHKQPGIGYVNYQGSPYITVPHNVNQAYINSGRDTSFMMPYYQRPPTVY